MNAPNWLITGGCGFIGRTLIQRIQALNAASSIRVVDNLSASSLDDLQLTTDFNEASSKTTTGWKPGVELITADIRDQEVVSRCTVGADVVVHLAANTGVQPSILDPRTDFQINVLGTLNMLEAARHSDTSKFIFASSGAPLGSAPPPFNEETPCRPVSPYGASKMAGEAYCSAYNGSFGLQTYSLRFSNVYGPSSAQKGSVVAKLIRQALSGEDWVISGDGTQTRDFIFSEDLVDAIINAAIYDTKGGLYQIATSVETTINSLASQLSKELMEHSVPTPRIRYCEMMPGDVLRNFAQNSKRKKS